MSKNNSPLETSFTPSLSFPPTGVEPIEAIQWGEKKYAPERKPARQRDSSCMKTWKPRRTSKKMARERLVLAQCRDTTFLFLFLLLAIISPAPTYVWVTERKDSMRSRGEGRSSLKHLNYLHESAVNKKTTQKTFILWPIQWRVVVFDLYPLLQVCHCSLPSDRQVTGWAPNSKQRKPEREREKVLHARSCQSTFENERTLQYSNLRRPFFILTDWTNWQVVGRSWKYAKWHLCIPLSSKMAISCPQ